MAASELSALYATAAAAVDAAEYDTAIRAALKARLLLAITPNASQSSSGSTDSLTWANAAACEAFITTCRQLKAMALAAATGPYQTTKVQYARAADTGAY